MSDIIKKTKPLGGKAYGSIGHLPTSRTGPGDWTVHEGQARICCEKPRKGDTVIVTEKLDGACMAVAKINGEVIPLSRAGYRAEDGTFEHLRAFAPYVEKHKSCFDALLAEGERVCGEWLALAHGTRYDSGHPGFSPFIAFDIIRDGARVPYDEFRHRVFLQAIQHAQCVHCGPNGCPIESAMAALGNFGFHGAMELCEGAVWRVEREGRVDFLAKYVRPTKVDGIYLENLSGKPPVWNWRPEA
jgi:hypothetical protein